MRNIFPLLYLLATACSGSSNAQPSLGAQIEQARIEMMRQTVEFLATDDSAFKQVNTFRCDCRSWDDIQKFIDANKLTNVDKVMLGIIEKKADTTEANWEKSLLGFKTSIIDNFFTKKSYRKNKPEYAEFEQKLLEQISNIHPPVKAVANNKPPVKKSEPPVVPPQAIKEKEDHTYESSVFLSPIGIGLSAGMVLLLVVSYLLFIAKNKIKGQYELEARARKNLNDELIHQRESLEIAKSRNCELEDVLQQVKQEKQNLEKLLNNKSYDAVGAQAVSFASAPVQQKKVLQVKKYAKYADTGDGFSDVYLLDQPNNETIFEITVTAPDKATYIVSTDPNVQKYALSNTDYFLRKTCQYDSFPSGNSTIYTDVPGELRRDGNKWSILSVAKISFN